MSLIHPAILYGLGLAAIPIILHFLLRTKPKKLLFPALRLIQVRRRRTIRRLRLRHIWLLLLRVAVISLLVLAVARPSLPAANYAPTLGEWVSLLAIALLAAGVYMAVARSWRQRQLPQHAVRYRRAILRGATGAGALALLLLLFVWPYQRRIAAEIKAPLTDVADKLPAAAVFLFDTSVSMQYRWNSKTRLEVAQEIALEHLRTLPSDSRVAVADTASDNPILFRADYASAQEQISNLQPDAVSLPLDVRLHAALRLQEEDRGRIAGADAERTDGPSKDRYLREIYLLTDMARTAWQAGGATSLADELRRLPWIQVYIIDVGVDEPRNIGLASPTLSKQTIPLGSDLVVSTTVEAIGVENAKQGVEIYVQNERGKLVKQGQRSIQIDPGTGTRVSFNIPGLTGPFHQGELRLLSSDPLPIDDTRYFTVSVQPPPEILIVEESRDESYILRQALSPTEAELQGKNRHHCTYLSAENLEDARLDAFDVVCLVNVRSPNEAAWNNLARFVRSGGGLLVIAGHRRLDPLSYNGGPAQTLLPARLEAQTSFEPPEFLDLDSFQHPLFRRFESFPGGFGELRSVDIRRCWQVEPLMEAHVIAEYTDPRRLPALVERLHGEGRTLLLTTAIDRQGWSDIPFAGWQFFVLADQMMQHLGRQADSIFNYLAGEEVSLPLESKQNIARLLVRKPGFQQIPEQVPPGAAAAIISDADQVGHYEVVAAESESRFNRAFSMNAADGESRFVRMDKAALDDRLGEDRYSIAANIDGLTRNVNTGRVGVEAFSFLLAGLLAVFCLEHVVANRFYEAEQSATHQ